LVGVAGHYFWVLAQDQNAGSHTVRWGIWPVTSLVFFFSELTFGQLAMTLQCLPPIVQYQEFADVCLMPTLSPKHVFLLLLDVGGCDFDNDGALAGGALMLVVTLFFLF
jgi:hypothetical protein